MIKCIQLSIFDLEQCFYCKNITREKYRTEGKIMDFCNIKSMYIDRDLTVKESCNKFDGGSL